MTSTSYRSTNQQRHTRTGRIARWHLNSFNEAIFEMVAKSGAQTVLDAGCGEGFVAAYLTSRDPALRLTGIDLSGEAVSYAQTHFGHAISFSQGSILDLPFDDDSFDAVVCSEVLEHLTDWERALGELKRVARHHVIVTVPREPHFKLLNDAGRALRYCEDPGHVNFWSWRAFKAVFSPHFEGVEFRRKHYIYQLVLGRLGGSGLGSM